MHSNTRQSARASAVKIELWSGMWMPNFSCWQTAAAVRQPWSLEPSVCMEKWSSNWPWNSACSLWYPRGCVPDVLSSVSRRITDDFLKNHGGCSETLVSANILKSTISASRWGFIWSLSGRIKFDLALYRDSLSLSKKLLYAGFSVLVFSFTTSLSCCTVMAR